MGRRAKASVVIVGIVAVTSVVTLAKGSAPAAGAGGSPSMPSGSLAFTRRSAAGDTASLFIAGASGEGAHRLVTGDAIESAGSAIWSPDGASLLITNTIRWGGDLLLPFRPAVERARTSGHPLRPATFFPGSAGKELLDGATDPRLNLGCGAVSPDATTLALEGFDDERPERKGIYSVRASDGGGLVRLTHGQDVAPVYSPDGRRIAFTRDAGDTPNDVGAIYVMDADGSDQHRISPHVSASFGKAWSPDERWIVFSDPLGALYLVHPDGSELHRVAVTLPDGTGAFYPTWSPDGSKIAFSLQGDAGWDLYWVELDGSGLRQITDTPGVQESAPDWAEPPA